MDALTWFKTVFHRARPTPDLLHADVASESWADVPPLHVVAARLRPSPPPADDEDWDAVIVRAKMQAAAPRPPRLPPPLPPRRVPPEMIPTPLPTPQRRAGIPDRASATLDALLRGGLKKPGAPLRSFAGRRPAPEDVATPPPVGKAHRAVGR